jgi:hypothetical protein
LLARDSQSLPDSKRNSNEHANTIPLTNRGPWDRGAHRISALNARPWAPVVLVATVAMAMGFGGLGLITVFMDPMKTELGWFAEPIRGDAFYWGQRMAGPTQVG